MTFNPSNWYFTADDGRVFSTARMLTTDANDAGYLAFVATNGGSARWPVDEGGAQTVASIQDVLSAHGMFADLTSYAANARWAREVGGISVNGVPVATDDRSKQMIMGARIAAQTDPSFATPWVGADGTVVTLTAPQIIAISNAVLLHVQACFATFASLQAGITAAPPTVTTTAQVDAAFAAINA